MQGWLLLLQVWSNPIIFYSPRGNGGKSTLKKRLLTDKKSALGWDSGKSFYMQIFVFTGWQPNADLVLDISRKWPRSFAVETYTLLLWLGSRGTETPNLLTYVKLTDPIHSQWRGGDRDTQCITGTARRVADRLPYLNLHNHNALSPMWSTQVCVW